MWGKQEAGGPASDYRDLGAPWRGGRRHPSTGPVRRDRFAAGSGTDPVRPGDSCRARSVSGGGKPVEGLAAPAGAGPAGAMGCGAAGLRHRADAAPVPAAVGAPFPVVPPAGPHPAIPVFRRRPAILLPRRRNRAPVEAMAAPHPSAAEGAAVRGRTIPADPPRHPPVSPPPRPRCSACPRPPASSARRWS